MKFLKNIFNGLVAFAYFTGGFFLHSFAFIIFAKFLIPLDIIEDAIISCLGFSMLLSFQIIFGFFWWEVLPNWMLENM